SSMSSPSFDFKVAFMSISVSTPKPCSDNAVRVCSTASTNEVCSVVDNASVMAGTSLSRARRSGQGEEELFEFRLGHRLLAVLSGVGQAFLQTCRDDLETRAVEGAGNRGELGNDVLAVAAL